MVEHGRKKLLGTSVWGWGCPVIPDEPSVLGKAPWLVARSETFCIKRRKRPEILLKRLVSAYESKLGKKIEIKTIFMVERGPIMIVAVMDESSSKSLWNCRGLYISICSMKDLLILTVKQINPGEQGYLYDWKHWQKWKQRYCGASHLAMKK